MIMVGRVNAGMPAAFLHYWLAMARPTWTCDLFALLHDKLYRR